MNVVKEIAAINARELASGSSASWHDQYKDSAYVYVGGLPHQLTEGDVITIFSQYGEVVDISLPRDQTTQKPKGFAFLMYADQRSTVLAVDNLGGAKVLERTLRVDHVLNYKQLKRDEESGKMVERETQSLAAHPDNFKSLKAAASDDSSDAESAASSHPSIDIDDPMRDYLIQQSREKKRSTSTKRIKGTKKDKEKKRERKEGESKEERKERRERKKIKLGLIVAPVRRDDTRRDDTRRIEGRDEEKGKGRSIEQERFSGDSRRVGGVRERAMDSYAATSSRDVDADRRDGHSRSTHHGREDDSRTTHGREDDDRRRDRGDGDGDASESRRRDSRREEDRRDSRREEERRDLRRDEERGGRKVSAFADLEKWAKGA